MRVLVEVCATVAGLIAAAVIAYWSAWGYPRGASDIWTIAYLAMGVTLLLGGRALWRAYLEDRESLRRKPSDD